jgi:hypothetical protein
MRRRDFYDIIDNLPAIVAAIGIIFIILIPISLYFDWFVYPLLMLGAVLCLGFLALLLIATL